VVVIATIIAIGTGVYAGLGSTSRWRRISNDASFAKLNMHDLRIKLSNSTFANQGDLVALSSHIKHASAISQAAERLIVPTQVEADGSITKAGNPVLVKGRLVGLEISNSRTIDAVATERGKYVNRQLSSGPNVLIETKFASHYGFPTTGSLTLAGAKRVFFEGFGITPEYFLITGGNEGGFLGEANFAVVFASLFDAQQLSGLNGKVNDLVLTLSAGADREMVRKELVSALDSNGTLSATVTTRNEEPSYRLLYDDIKGDQKLWTVMSLLVLVASAIAAFNLISRIVESERREIGIQMALGVPPRRMALRPMLIGGQIALIGAVLGVGVGMIVGNAMRSMLVDIVPLPVWRTPFQWPVFLSAAALGFILPFAASAYPVWRAIHVEPIEAIRTSHLTATTGWLSTFGQRIHIPGNSLTQLPLRNVLRTPRRTLLTAMGVGAAIAALVGVLGMLNSFTETIHGAESEITKQVGDRVVVELDGFRPVDSAAVNGIVRAPMIGSADLRVEVPATLRTPGHDEISVLASAVDFAKAQWAPTVTNAKPSGARPGLVLSRKAARDLGVKPGGTVTLVHPRREGLTGYTMTESTFVVIGLHPNPLRSLVFFPMKDLQVFGLTGLTNVIDVRPAAGFVTRDVERAMFTQSGVSSAQPVSAMTDLYKDALKQFVGFLVITDVAVMILALLIAFNTTSVAVDERARAHATLFAFGLRVRKVVAIIVKESVLVGFVSTLFGIAMGYVLLRWMVYSLLGDTVPQFGIRLYLSPWTLVTALVVGVGAVGFTPMLLIGRLRRMNIPDTLRVME
jgi:putative ABC transport system permease protein